MMHAIVFPNIDPVALHLFSLEIRWYALAYIAGVMLGYLLLQRLLLKADFTLSKKAKDDIIIYSVFGIVIGGRLGYVIFYDLSAVVHEPLMLFRTWNGGMSFHGGLLGVIVSMYAYTRKHMISFLKLMDLIVCVAPIGIFLGRIANFINGELYGNITALPWGVVFPNAGDMPRHPSQLYEAMAEGMFLFLVMQILFYFTTLRIFSGKLTGIFLCLYGIARIGVETLREPDMHLGYFFNFLTMGQILSIPLCILGLVLIFRRASIK